MIKSVAGFLEAMIVFLFEVIKFLVIDIMVIVAIATTAAAVTLYAVIGLARYNAGLPFFFTFW